MKVSIKEILAAVQVVCPSAKIHPDGYVEAKFTSTIGQVAFYTGVDLETTYPSTLKPDSDLVNIRFLILLCPKPKGKKLDEFLKAIALGGGSRFKIRVGEDELLKGILWVEMDFSMTSSVFASNRDFFVQTFADMAAFAEPVGRDLQKHFNAMSLVEVSNSLAAASEAAKNREGSI